MKAAVLHGAKDIRVEDFKMPDVSPGMILLKVQRVGICGSDLHYFQDGYCGAFTPSKPSQHSCTTSNSGYACRYSATMLRASGSSSIIRHFFIGLGYLDGGCELMIMLRNTEQVLPGIKQV